MSLGANKAALMGTAGGGSAAADFYSYQIPYSARFDGSTSTIIKTWGTAPTSTTKKTISVWIKRSLVGNATAQRIITAGSGSTGSYYLSGSLTDGFGYYAGVGGVNGYTTARVFRDPSAWFHFVAIFDSGESNDYDRIKFYFNGEIYPLNNGDWTFNAGYPNTAVPELGADGYANYIGVYVGGSGYFNGYMADFIQIDGTAAISDFGETINGVWVPKDPSGLTFGTNGYWLDFADDTDFGNDVSGNNNDWTAAGLSTHDQMLDSPTFNSDSNGGNFCTLNGAAKYSTVTLSEGNLQSASGDTSRAANVWTTFGFSSGKIYFEGTNFTGTNTGYPAITVQNSGLQNFSDTNYYGYGITRQGSYIIDGTATAVVANLNVSGAASDVRMFAIDFDAGKIWAGRNGTWYDTSGTSYTNATGPESGSNYLVSGFSYPTAIISFSHNDGGCGGNYNFGSDGTFAGNKTAGGNADDTGYGNFLYDVPAGFLAACTGNITTAAAVDPAQTDDNYPQELFFMSGYNGNGTNRTITTENQTDLLMIRHWSSGQNWYTLDSTRVITDNKFIDTNSSDAEDTLPQANITSVGATSVGISSSSWLNSGGSSYQMWMWRANGGTTSAGSGDLTSTHQVDPSGGFSIVKAVGDGGSGDKTISHGLSAAPTCILSKNLDSTYNWDTYFSEGVTAGSGMRLNTNETPFTGRWGTISSSIFTCKDGYTWASTNNYIYYCFTNIEGYIKAGSYEGNGDADGTFVYTGFRPAFIVTKSVDSTSDWQAFDILRDGYNVDNNAMAMNEALTQTTTDMIDILSNGFKMRIATDPNVAETYVYLAMAKNPFQYATAR